MMLLTEEQIVKEASKDKEYCQLSVDVGMWAAREQLKKVMEYLEERWNGTEWGIYKIVAIPKKDWQALRKEVG